MAVKFIKLVKRIFWVKIMLIFSKILAIDVLYKYYICDSFRALAAVLPGCLATVVKSHRTWKPTLRFHPPA